MVNDGHPATSKALRGKRAVAEFDFDSLVGMKVSEACETVEGIGGKFWVLGKGQLISSPHVYYRIKVTTDDTGKIVTSATRGSRVRANSECRRPRT